MEELTAVALVRAFIVRALVAWWASRSNFTSLRDSLHGCYDICIRVHTGSFPNLNAGPHSTFLPLILFACR